MIHLLLNKLGVDFVSLSLFGSKNDEEFKGLLIIITTVLIPLKFCFPGILSYIRDKIFKKVMDF